MEKIRDEWQNVLHEKEFEIKRTEAEFAARTDRLIEDYQSHSSSRFHELKQEHMQQIESYKAQMQFLKSQNDDLLNQSIKVEDHERILNQEIQKVENAA